MKESAERARPVGPESYTDDYYRSAVEGHAQYAASGGRELSARLALALELAAPRPGERVLDVACGRGELVLQSALRGAYAVGIDYADAAMAFARRSLDGDSSRLRASLACMDATRLAFRSQTFDIALMLDFVEHVHQPDLERALDEVHSALKPGGRLIIHTTPNRLFEDVVYRHYVTRVHGAILAVGRWLRLKEGLFLNEIMLPTDPQPLRGDYERELHVNPQWPGALRGTLRRHQFRIRRMRFRDPARGPFFARHLRWHNVLVRLLDAVRFLRPLSRYPPLDRFFSDHIWVVAERR